MLMTCKGNNGKVGETSHLWHGVFILHSSLFLCISVNIHPFSFIQKKIFALLYCLTFRPDARIKFPLGSSGKICLGWAGYFSFFPCAFSLFVVLFWPFFLWFF